MSMVSILGAIQKGVEYVESIPLLKDIPGIGTTIETAVSAAGAVTEVVTNLIDLAKQGQAIMSASDQTTLEGYISRLEAANKVLDDWIDANP